MPFPYIANEAGWVVTEVGRQPWIVYGLMRTAASRVADGERRRNDLHDHRLRRNVFFARRVVLCARAARNRARPVARGARHDAATVAFGVIAFMLTAYVLLDGYDLGIADDFTVHRAQRPRASQRRWQHRTVLERQRGVVDCRRRCALRALSNGLCLVVLGVLSAVHRRAVAADVPRHRVGTARTFVIGIVASILGHGVFGLEHAVGRVIRRRAGQSDARGTARRDGYFQGTFSFLLNPYAMLVGGLCVVALACTARRSRCADRRTAGRAGGAHYRRIVVVRSRAVRVVSAATLYVRGFGGHWATYGVRRDRAGCVDCDALRRARADMGALCSVVVLHRFAGALAAGTMYPYLLPALSAGSRRPFDRRRCAVAGALRTALTVTIVGSIAVLRLRVRGIANVWRESCALRTTYASERSRRTIARG